MSFVKGLLLFLAGVISTFIALFIISTSEHSDLTPQEQRYNACLETVYQGFGDNKITLDSDKASSADRLSMKKFCLCVSDIDAENKLLEKKIANFKKKHNNEEPSAAEYDVMRAEVDAERTEICNKQS